YAGLRPARVQKLVCLDSLLLPGMNAEQAPQNARRWLDGLQDPPRQKFYSSFEDLAGRIRKRHPRLSPERARFIAHCWGREDGYGRIALCADPKHRLPRPTLYRVEESVAVWKEVTAPTLFLDGEESALAKAIPREEIVRRRAAFRRHREAALPGAGHMLHFDAPEDTARNIAAFLQE
ncbi:MAG: alpha/beta hydrolase, partial [Nevskiales bacterium]|nr:alpha/beta hydrolase [Nevskiales bacterium]